MFSCNAFILLFALSDEYHWGYRILTNLLGFTQFPFTHLSHKMCNCTKEFWVDIELRVEWQKELHFIGHREKNCQVEGKWEGCCCKAWSWPCSSRYGCCKPSSWTATCWGNYGNILLNILSLFLYLYVLVISIWNSNGIWTHGCVGFGLGVCIHCSWHVPEMVTVQSFLLGRYLGDDWLI